MLHPSALAYSISRQRPASRPAEPNPRTGLPSHLGPTLERIDQLLDDSGSRDESSTQPSKLLVQLRAIDREMQQARGHDEVLALLDKWARIVDVDPISPSAAEENDETSSRRARSQSWPAKLDAERWFAPNRMKSRQQPRLFSPRSGRMLLCAFDETEKPAAASAFALTAMQRVEVRAFAKATAILLDALLAMLLRLTERVITARQYWASFSARPLQYAFWCGPSRWFGPHTFGLFGTYYRTCNEPAERVRALSELVSLMAGHVGRVHASLVEFLRCCDRESLQEAAKSATETFDGLLSPGQDFPHVNPSSAQGSPFERSPPGVDQLHVMRRKVSAAARRWSVYESRLCEELRDLDIPSHLSRNWVRYAVGTGAVLCGAALARRFGHAELIHLGRSLRASLSQWWTEHLTEPLSYMYHELVHRRYLVVSDQQQLEDARRSLAAMVNSFSNRHKLLVLSADVAGECTPEELALAAPDNTVANGEGVDRKAHVGRVAGREAAPHDLAPAERLAGPHVSEPSQPPDMVDMQLTAISRLFEKQAGSAVYNLVSGDLVEIMLIQMTLLKKEVFEMMAALDQLMRENYFTASMMAAVPGTLAVGMLLAGIWRLLRKVRGRWARKYSRRSVQKRMRNSLRDIERLLLRYHTSPCAESSMGSDGAISNLQRWSTAGHVNVKQLTLHDRGVLVLELHNLLHAVHHHHHLFEHTDMQNLVEDLHDLECDTLTAAQKLHTVGRVYRTQPILGMSNRAIWAPLAGGVLR